MTTKIELTERHLHLLRRTLGADGNCKRNYGYRNRYIAANDTEPMAQMRELESMGLVKDCGELNIGKDVYFVATVQGCEAIGLSKSAIRRALEE